MDSFSSPSSGSSPQFSANEFRDQLKTQLAQAYAEEFLEISFPVDFEWGEGGLEMTRSLIYSCSSVHVIRKLNALQNMESKGLLLDWTFQHGRPVFLFPPFLEAITFLHKALYSVEYLPS
ncbi:mitochondrial import inner membrane translocase subunit Tim13 [Cucumis melo var. makuwa]|uniref:Mitochondrial import inner membrane translocase subunit Tim13 n=1 Tax=Cucumis melo var. makuwa TaxID=1194695 RepID=A0A5D3C411_CUCMM|nr:mitochondrial import inner membrane translocase subunit Tim13 [Cucumis melo var. makuwa]TYK06034.1 mitochondrial import inner membrane translocase subunit Tim13 [Cucumis melo var. makuwa]